MLAYPLRRLSRRSGRGSPGSCTVFWEGTERSAEEFLRIMAEEQRLIHQFEVIRSYGLC